MFELLFTLGAQMGTQYIAYEKRCTQSMTQCIAIAIDLNLDLLKCMQASILGR